MPRQDECLFRWLDGVAHSGRKRKLDDAAYELILPSVTGV